MSPFMPSMLHALLLRLAVAGALGALCAGAPPAAAAAPPIDLRVMTYNLRYASPTGPNAWPQRRPLMRKLIVQQAPDIIGTQEGLYGQLRELAADLPAYHWIGLGRDGGSRGEFMAIFYKRARFEPVAFDHFWLSDTPQVIGSSTWGHSNRRMVTWVRLRELSSRREFYVWNTHLDHEVEAARQKSAALIRDRIASLEDAAVPLLLLGDFNSPAGASVAYDILTKEAQLSDAWVQASGRVNERTNTYNGFQPPREDGQRIDWILFRGQADVSRAEVVTFSEGGRFPSDHFPVVARLRLR